MSGATYPFSLEPVVVPHIETPHRRIATPLPVPASLPVLRTLLQHEPRSMAIDQLPVVWDRAVGHSVYDKYGNSGSTSRLGYSWPISGTGIHRCLTLFDRW